LTTHYAPVAGVSLMEPAPGLFVGRIEGHYTEAMLRPYLAAMDVAFGRAAIFRGFHDWELMTGYETICRKEMTVWVQRHRARVAPQHILVRSRMVAMGVATANLVLGGDVIISHFKRSAFEQALARASAGLPDER
jgi:hypothetical protein